MFGVTMEEQELDFIDFFEWMMAEVHETAVDRKWWDKPRDDGTLIALMHSELSEALETLRLPDEKDRDIPHLRALTVEFADCVIRIMDFCQRYNLNLAEAIVKKNNFNKTRSERHGGKNF